MANPALLYLELGELRYRQGDKTQALADLRAAARADPTQPMVLNRLTWLLATDPDPKFRNGNEAVQMGERLLAVCENSGQLQPIQQAALLDTVGVSYAEAGRFDDALATVRRALELARAANHPQLIGILESRAKLYAVKQPYHETAAGQSAN